MSKTTNILIELEKVFQYYFKKGNLKIDTTTTAADIDDWDSLNHMNLISTIEEHFKIQFEFMEVMEFENIGELVKSINEKL